MLLKVMNLQQDYVAVLENAYSVGYDKKTNNLWTAKFKLPLNDPKNDQVQHFRFVEIWETEEQKDEDYIGLFQIMPKLTSKNTQNQEVSYECTHVLRTLFGKSLFKFHQSDGHTTKENLEWLLSKQDPNETYWVLGECAFTRYFSYAFENENLLNAILSIPKPFDVQYRWAWNTRTFPWKLSLVEAPTEPICRLDEGYNLVGFSIEENPNELYNRIYPLGAGEGVNQLDITKINGGKPYVENPESIKKYGLQEYVWPDKRFTLKENMKASAEGLLAKWSEPVVSWECSAAYLYQLTGLSIDKFKEGEVVRVRTFEFGEVDLRISREQRQDIQEKPGDINLVLGNLKADLGTTATDTERRQQINELWSQGATNVIPYVFIAEADPEHPITFRPYLDDDIVHVNTAELTLDTTYFRATSKGNTSSPQTVSSSTSSAGGGSVQSATSSAGGSSVQTATSSANGSHRHRMFVFDKVMNFNWGELTTANVFMGYNRDVPIYVSGSARVGDLYTDEAADNHSHNVSINTPAHTHNVSINIPAHTHNVSITVPGHTHDIVYGIFEYDRLPSKIEVKVDGNVVPLDSTSVDRLNLIPYLNKTDDGSISRGRHTIEIKPNDLARIEVQMILRVFIRSNLGGEF